MSGGTRGKGGEERKREVNIYKWMMGRKIGEIIEKVGEGGEKVGVSG